MGSAQLRVLTQAKQHAGQASGRLHELIPPGKLVELSGKSDVAVTTTAVRILREAQLGGETSAWIQTDGGSLYPPDLDDAGIDLDALVVVHIPRSAGPSALCKAAELLLRSGSFGLVIMDLGTPPAGSTAWQGRLLGLARQHHSRVVLITESSSQTGSLGPLISLRIEPGRTREGPGKFVITHEVLKNKSGAPLVLEPEQYRGPWGLG